MSALMERENAFSLIQQYINGWKENNILLITSCLDKDCIVIESHGPTYHSISEIEQWLHYWLESNSRVLNWDILSFYFCEKAQIAFCEWNFSCMSNHIQYTLPGISIVKFNNQKIAFIHEYRMTKDAYDWGGEELISE